MKLHKIIFGISILLLLASVIVLSVKFPSVPETIPIHYSGNGPDGFGSKNFLWLEAGVNFILLCLFAVPIFFPEKMFSKSNNYLETSSESAIKNRQAFLSVLSVIVTLIFCGLSLKEII
ncbi:DUF1648 domain-containing protein [Chryseobacterium taichungense]|uniref:DUF1648 domain-containing protein n=1 Tax=Chryseobacterium taichungense TaxID=295069 RepID=UPI0028B246D9|nr:DUF1648 domain-containing protein [Chryseobacterium taichungense]